MHAVVTRSTFPSHNAKSTALLEHFWKLRCGKSARNCGAKQSNGKDPAHVRTMIGSSVQAPHFCTMSGSSESGKSGHGCGAKWREAHVEVTTWKRRKRHRMFTPFSDPYHCDFLVVQRILHLSKSKKNVRVS